MSSKKKKVGKRGSPDSPRKKQKQLEKERAEEELRLIEEEALKLKQEALTESLNYARREKLLRSCCQWFRDLGRTVEALEWKKRQNIEWEKYVNCGNLPIAHNIQMMNTYLFLLKDQQILWNVDYCFEMGPKLLSLIETVDNYIANPLGASYQRINNWKEVRKGFRDIINESFNMMCYKLIKNLKKNLKANDLWTFEFRKRCPDFFIGMWVFGEYPKLSGYPNQEFPEVGVFIDVPQPYDRRSGVLRVMKLSYNHLNDRSITWTCPELPLEYHMDMYQNQTDWFFEKIRMLDDFKLTAIEPVLGEWEPGMFFKNIIQNSKEELSQFNETNLEPLFPKLSKERLGMEHAAYTYKMVGPPETFNSLMVDVPINEIVDKIRHELEIDWTMKFTRENYELPTIEELVEKCDAKPEKKKSMLTVRMKSDMEGEKIRITQMLEDMDRIYTEQVIWKSLTTLVDGGEINLRKFNVIGSLFCIELFKLPEQEILLHDKSRLTTMVGEQTLQKHDFEVSYEPPSIVEEKQEEDENKERKKGDNIKKLMNITIGLEDNCLWFEPPKLVQWDSVRECWTDEWIIEPKYNEEKQQFTFKSGHLGIYSFCVPRYSNLPLQTWDVRPESEDIVLLNITASTIVVDFKIKKGEVCISQLQNAPTSVLDPLINHYMDPPILIKKMRRAGLDIFPEADSFKFVEGSNYKDLILENHTYSCLGLVSNAYNFTWSRWNSFGGRNKIVMQMRESIEKGAPYQMLLSAQDKALVVDCTEVSPSFSEIGIEGMEFYPDIYSMICYHASIQARDRINAAHPCLVSTVAYMLKATKVFTFS